jgi:hypothetical protein
VHSLEIFKKLHRIHFDALSSVFQTIASQGRPSLSELEKPKRIQCHTCSVLLVSRLRCKTVGLPTCHCADIVISSLSLSFSHSATNNPLHFLFSRDLKQYNFVTKVNIGQRPWIFEVVSWDENQRSLDPSPRMRCGELGATIFKSG